MPIQAEQSRIVQVFRQISSWEEKYKLIIQKGRGLPELPEHLYEDNYLVRGCQSKVWMHAELQEGRVQIQADSDAAIVKGLIALLIEVYSDQTPEEILHSKPDFIKKIGLNVSLSQTRANGLVAMIQQIHLYAQAFQAMKKSSVKP